MFSQCCSRWWLGAIRQQAITSTNADPDLCHRILSRDHNELKKIGLIYFAIHGWQYGCWHPISVVRLEYSWTSQCMAPELPAMALVWVKLCYFTYALSKGDGGYTGFTLSISLSRPCPSVCRWGFQSLQKKSNASTVLLLGTHTYIVRLNWFLSLFSSKFLPSGGQNHVGK